jgi:hypothetical protein
LAREPLDDLLGGEVLSTLHNYCPYFRAQQIAGRTVGGSLGGEPCKDHLAYLFGFAGQATLLLLADACEQIGCPIFRCGREINDLC